MAPATRHQARAEGRCFLFCATLILWSLRCGIHVAAEERTVEVGGNATLQCPISNSGVWWTFNGRNVTSEDLRYKPSSITLNQHDRNVVLEQAEIIKLNNTLTIINVDIKDEGNFTCRSSSADASADDSTAGETTIFLQPTIRAKIVGEQAAKVKKKIDESVELFCLVEVYPTEPYRTLIKWRKDDDNTLLDLKNETTIKVLNATHINATFEVKKIKKKDNGTYVCSVSSAETGDELTNMKVDLLVLDIPQISIDFVKAVGSSKIFLNWTVNDGNSPVSKYFVTYLQGNNSGFTYYNHPIDGKKTSYVLEGFTANMTYRLKMSAKNAIGDSAAMEYPHPVKTLEKDPVFIPQIEVTGSSSSTMTIGWPPPPPELLEYIDYYEPTVWDASDNSSIIEKAYHPQNSRNLPYMFDNLKSRTMYSFKVRACSEMTKLCGPWSQTVNGTTIEGKASEPLNVRTVCTHYNITRRNSVKVDWDPPATPNGKIISYQVILKGLATYRSNGSMLNETYGPKIRNIDEKSHFATFEEVPPNTNYTVDISAVNGRKRPGNSSTGTCTMPVTVPDHIGRVSWVKIKVSEEQVLIRLHMDRTSERNGPICCYRIYLVRITDANKHLPIPEHLDISTYSKVHSPNNTRGGAYIAEMFSGEHFRSEILLGDGGNVISEEDRALNDELCRKCLEGVPFRRQARKVLRTTPFTTTETPAEERSQREQLVKAGNLTQAASKILGNKRRRRNQQSGASNPNHLFESTTWSPTVDPKPDLDVFDGPIDISSDYTGFIEIAVRNDLNEGGDRVLFLYSDYFETILPGAEAQNLDDVDDVSYILNIVVQVLCALIVLVLLLLAALCFMHRYYSKQAVQGEEVISLRDSLSRALCGGRTSNHRHLIGSALAKPADISPISKHDLAQAYINRHKDTDYGFLREYEMLPNRFNDRTTKNSDFKENSHKNRYPDIKAYDQTRVKLSASNGMQGSDYINANFVIGYKERKKFICAQGPMDSTINDFWRMIWEQHLEIIVMLTNLEEYNKAKCAKYWPEKVNDSKQFGDITVVFASEQRYSDYLVRNLDVYKKNGSNNEDDEERRQITQYHYLVWKDFMAPEHPHGIIKFIRQINAVYSVQRGPILVHCSAGVGRTGTLVALDSLTQQLEEEGQVSIFNTVCDLRHQRNFLVQSLKQYIFLYRALLDIAQFGNTELPARGLNSIVESLKLKPNDSKEKCKLELEFERIKSIQDETNKSCSVGSGEENSNKNRSELVIPYDRNRVILTPIPTREHSTYINASFIEGYDNSESFIITQDPMENTIGDFWRMISEQGITTLVMISEIGDGPRKCPRYWADDEVQYDHILVKYMHSESCPYYTRREFNVTNCKIDDTIKVTQFQYNGWPTVDGEVPEVSRGIIELVDQAQRHHNTEMHFSTLSPIAVHCSLGTDRSSIFVSMCILVQQLRTEKKVDICTTARKLRSQRSMLLDTYAQYEFLHRAIVNYADLHKLSLESPSD
ncbi:unnamed protein product [Hermetia illucens]|uniref:protein-tyrosine-phosphatase n=1 Tax=Hermetia illucens TaxID=343691 RepID=A0A7R8UKX9_HERIL|nr:tyrosine-protein phosphatase 69D isoform X2 [Hermetia illucens]CAD7082783.1 unnamed protein product [Hermetia illucens]